MSKESTLARDLLARAAHTFYQAAIATFAALWAQSDLDVSELAHGNGWPRLYSAVIVGAIAAGVSAVKTAGIGYLESRRAKLIQVGIDAAQAATPKLQADVDSGDLAALIKDVKQVAKSAESAAVDTLQPTTIDGEHPAAADPDNKP